MHGRAPCPRMLGDKSAWARRSCPRWRGTRELTAPVAREDGVAVGTLIAERPPHRSVRAAFPHTAPTLGKDEQALRLVVYVSAHGARMSGTESGSCFAD